LVQSGVSVLKKLLLLFILLIPLLFASDLKTEQKIYKLIIHTLLPEKKEIKVWSDSLQNEKLLKTIPNLIVVKDSKDADFLLLDQQNITNTKGIIFVSNYKLLQKLRNKAVGGFFWQKGRPNILFLQENLKKRNITLPQSMQEYIEDEL
jgi:hypothetical protein